MRTLYPDEAALWAAVMASVRPMRPAPSPVRQPAKPAPAPAAPTPVGPRPRATVVPRTKAVARTPHDRATLDGSWDKVLARGAVYPDSAIDLHGHTLASAHALLDEGLDRAIRRGDRVLLLVTGKPPRAESERPHARGAIRAAVADWLTGSRHADRIAAVRGAHPRHGGQGALYIVLRRPRQGAPG